MRRFFYIFLLGSILFIMHGCGGYSNVTYISKKIYLHIDNTAVPIDAEEVKQRYDSYGSLHIKQKILRLKEGNIVVYEDAITDSEYAFENGILETIKVVFNAKDMYLLYIKNHLHIYQLLLENGKILNVIAQQDDMQELRILYGMRIDQMNYILKSIDPEAKGIYYKNILRIESVQDAVLSKWNVQKVHFHPLVSPIPRMMGM